MCQKLLTIILAFGAVVSSGRIETCQEPLGMSDANIIKDSQITVTSQHHEVVGAKQARLDTGNAWCTETRTIQK